MSGGNFHPVRDPGGMDIEGTPENPGKREGIVDLVGKIILSRPDNHCPGPERISRQYLRHGMGKGEDDRIGFIDLTILGMRTPDVMVRAMGPE
jgi:hypothetical protein